MLDFPLQCQAVSTVTCFPPEQIEGHGIQATSEGQ